MTIKVTITVSDGTHSKKYDLKDATPKGGKGKLLHFVPQGGDKVLESFGKLYIHKGARLS